MKTLKRILLIALALIMSLSTFACASDDPETEKPSEDNPTVETPTTSDLEGPEITKYVFDNQILTNNQFTLQIKDEPFDICFEEEEGAEWSVGATMNDDTVDIDVDYTMYAKNKKIKYYDENEVCFATIDLTINPVTKNYYNVDADTTNAGYTITTTAKATDVKFNGAAAGAGITVSDTGINFAKSLFTGETMGHNKVEYIDSGVKYEISVCAVTQLELDNPITFEDGKISPFISIFDPTKSAKVVNVFNEKGADGTSPLIDATKMRYYISADGNTQIENKHMLALRGNSRLYIAAYYLLARVDKLDGRLDFAPWTEDSGYALTAKGFCVTSQRYTYNKFFTQSEQHDFQNFAHGPWCNDGANFTPILEWIGYNALLAGDEYIYQVVPMGDTIKYMFYDDIGATLDNFDIAGQPWHGGNSTIHNQNNFNKTTQAEEYQAFRYLMDMVKLEG